MRTCLHDSYLKISFKVKSMPWRVSPPPPQSFIDIERLQLRLWSFDLYFFCFATSPTENHRITVRNVLFHSFKLYLLKYGTYCTKIHEYCYDLCFLQDA